MTVHITRALAGPIVKIRALVGKELLEDSRRPRVISSFLIEVGIDELTALRSLPHALSRIVAGVVAAGSLTAIKVERQHRA